MYSSRSLLETRHRAEMVTFHLHSHNMGDAGYILFGPIGRELLASGTVIFAVFATGGQLLAGALALSSLSDGKLCPMLYTGIFAIPTLLLSFPRTFHGLGFISVASVLSILIAGLVGMGAAGPILHVCVNVR